MTELQEAWSKLHDPSMSVTIALHNHPETFANLWRHEAALSRSSSRALHELRRLKAMRASEPVPAPAALDVDVNISGNGAVNQE